MSPPLKLFEFNPGSKGPLLHVAHANGFHPQTYQTSLHGLMEDYHILSYLARPFWSQESPDGLKHWTQLADDMVAALKTHKDKGIIGIGHSLGGVLTLYAAVNEPGLFSRLILIDPTMLSPKFLWQIKFMKFFGFEARSFLVKGALRRKRTWESSAEPSNTSEAVVYLSIGPMIW